MTAGCRRGELLRKEDLLPALPDSPAQSPWKGGRRFGLVPESLQSLAANQLLAAREESQSQEQEAPISSAEQKRERRRREVEEARARAFELVVLGALGGQPHVRGELSRLGDVAFVAAGLAPTRGSASKEPSLGTGKGEAPQALPSLLQSSRLRVPGRKSRAASKESTASSAGSLRSARRETLAAGSAPTGDRGAARLPASSDRGATEGRGAGPNAARLHGAQGLLGRACDEPHRRSGARDGSGGDSAQRDSSGRQGDRGAARAKAGAGSPEAVPSLLPGPHREPGVADTAQAVWLLVEDLLLLDGTKAFRQRPVAEEEVAELLASEAASGLDDEERVTMALRVLGPRHGLSFEELASQVLFWRQGWPPLQQPSLRDAVEDAAWLGEPIVQKVQELFETVTADTGGKLITRTWRRLLTIVESECALPPLTRWSGEAHGGLSLRRFQAALLRMAAELRVHPRSIFETVARHAEGP